MNEGKALEKEQALLEKVHSALVHEIEMIQDSVGQIDYRVNSLRDVREAEPKEAEGDGPKHQNDIVGAFEVLIDRLMYIRKRTQDIEARLHKLIGEF